MLTSGALSGFAESNGADGVALREGNLVVAANQAEKLTSPAADLARLLLQVAALGRTSGERGGCRLRPFLPARSRGCYTGLRNLSAASNASPRVRSIRAHSDSVESGPPAEAAGVRLQH